MATKKTETYKVKSEVKKISNTNTTSKPNLTGAISVTKGKTTSTAILSDSVVKKYKKQIDELSKQISQWEKALTEAETYLNSSTGSTFKANYAVGAKAATNIQKVIDILQACKSDLKKLTAAGTEFYKKIQTATKK